MIDDLPCFSSSLREEELSNSTIFVFFVADLTSKSIAEEDKEELLPEDDEDNFSIIWDCLHFVVVAVLVVIVGNPIR